MCAASRGQPKFQITTVSSVRRARSNERGLGDLKNLHFTTAFSVREVMSGSLGDLKKLAFHHSFERPTHTEWRKGPSPIIKIFISPQFWASDESPAAAFQTFPALKKKHRFSRRAAFSKCSLSLSSLFSAALLSSHPQLSFCCGQGLASYWHHLVVVRGSWSSCCGQLLAVNYEHVLWKNPLLRFREKRSQRLEVGEAARLAILLVGVMRCLASGWFQVCFTEVIW